MTRPGALLGNRFELQRQVAQDASTTAWEAVDLALDRQVLVKLLRVELANDQVAVERFRHDSRVAARQGSEPGRKVLDAGSDQRTGLPFVVFEWQAQATVNPTVPVAVARAAPAPSYHSPHRVGQRLLLLLLIVPVVGAAIAVRSWLDASGGAGGRFVAPPPVTLVISPIPAVGRQTAVPASDTPIPTPSPPAPRATATQVRPTQTQVAQTRRRIVNTDGIGVALRASPGGERLPGKGYDEGVTVTLLEQSGDWAHIRGDDGREGWVLAVTLA